MKRYLLVSLVLCGMALSASAAESIQHFDVTVRLEDTGSLVVSEEIDYDFGADSRHGIYRDIPVSYTDGIAKYSVRIHAVSVTDETGNPRPFTQSKQGRQIRLKIGDPDVTVSGRHTYVITYTVDRAVVFGDLNDEVYWNVTGSGWDVPISSATAQVVLPKSFNRTVLTSSCFEGAFGSTEPCFRAQLVPGSDGKFRSALFASAPLNSGEGLSVSLAFPTGVVTPPSFMQEVVWYISDNWPIAIPFVVFCLMFYLWWTRGRDPKGRGTIITQFEPPEGMSPGLVGTIYDESAHNKDISAEIIQLAILGYVTIEQTKKKKLLGSDEDYTLYKMKEAGSELTSHQRLLFSKLFGNKAVVTDKQGALEKVALSDLKNEFYKDLEKIKTDLYDTVVTQGYFANRPQRTRITGMVVGFVIIWLSVWIGGFMESFLFIVSMIVSGIIVGAFGFVMPKRTYQGVLAKEHIIGFRDYLRVVEKDRLKFHNAPEKKPQQFMQWLPYAMALGVEKEWAEQFKDLHISKPDWYVGSYGPHFNTVNFAHAMSSMNSSVASVLSSRPSSSGGGGGGGFSGGGFGGGGGGSW